MIGSLFWLAPALGGQLIPFGNLDELLKTQNPWFGFDSSQSPVLLVARAEMQTGPQVGACDAWRSALSQYPEGWQDRAQGWDAWTPWKKEDEETITECDDFPCKVKLNSGEVTQLSALKDDKRKAAFQRLVEERLQNYLKLGLRQPYEFAGTLTDPWIFFEKAGVTQGFTLSKQPEIGIRKFDFVPGKLRTVRQVLDRRLMVLPPAEPGAFIGALGLRDLYNTHYFDGWGEWIRVDCIPGSKLTVVHALMVELDTLKSTDFISRLSYSKMRNTVKEQGHRYLTAAFEQLNRQVKSSAKSRPESPSK